MKKVQVIIYSLICFIAIGVSSCEKEAIAPTDIQSFATINTVGSKPSGDLLIPDGNGYVMVEEMGYVVKQDEQYFIHTQGKIYQPNSLEEKFQAHKLQVLFSGKVRPKELHNEIIPIRLEQITAVNQPIDTPLISTGIPTTLENKTN